MEITNIAFNNLESLGFTVQKYFSKGLGHGISLDGLLEANKFLKKINPLIAEYAKEKSISLIIQKKNIVMGKTELDITSEIMDLIDKNIKQID